MSVRFVRQFRTYFPNDVAGFPAAREAELIASGIAVAHVGEPTPARPTAPPAPAPPVPGPAARTGPAPEPQTGGEGGPDRESNTSLGPDGRGRDLSQLGDASKGEQSNAEDTDQQTFKQPGITPDNGQGDAAVSPTTKQEETDNAHGDGGAVVTLPPVTKAEEPSKTPEAGERRPAGETTNRQTHTDGRSGSKTKTK